MRYVIVSFETRKAKMRIALVKPLLVGRSGAVVGQFRRMMLSWWGSCALRHGDS